MTPDGDCVTHERPRCSKGVLRKGDCFVGNPWCPDGTDHRDDNCVSRELPKCTEGYEWNKLDGQCRKKDKTECPDGYHEESGRCVSGDLPDCGEDGILEGKDCLSKSKPQCSGDTYWDGEDCRSPDEPDCGTGKRFKKDKGTCVTVDDPVCDDPDSVLDKTLRKCVLKNGPECPDGQKYNAATQNCVLLLGDCLEFEYCPVVTSL
jgi:hypothetical protein